MSSEFKETDCRDRVAKVVNRVAQEGENRVRVSGVKGYPPPDTTKLAIFYRGGYQCEMTINATGYATAWKYDYQEAQLRTQLMDWNLIDQFDVLDFQRVGVPKENPDSQLSSTTYLRIFAQAQDQSVLQRLIGAWMHNGMAHFAGMPHRAPTILVTDSR